MGWFDSVKSPKLKQIKKTLSSTPAGLWKKCTQCQELLQTSKLEENHSVCPYCEHHYRINWEKRVELLFDSSSFKPFKELKSSSDPLNFIDKKPYKDRLKQSQVATGLRDSCVGGQGTIDGQQVAVAIMEFSFMGGSMGVACGETIALAMDVACEKKIPCLVITCSGGARMQEGILSLMQMAKISGSRKKLKEAKLPYISLITDPTTGGCAASFAMQGDINIAEPGALIGFAGPRVIEQSIHQTLPDGFQRSEFLLEHGFIDRIIKRNKLKEEISFFIKMFDASK